MSKRSKRIRKILWQQIEERYKLMDNKVYRVIKKVRSGLKVGKEVNDAVKMLEDAKKAKDKVEDTVKAVDSAAKVLDATKIAAEASRKASVLLAAPTNPAAAAAGIAQEFIINGIDKEIVEVKNELNVVPKLLENLDKFIERSKEKLEEAIEEEKKKARIVEERKNNLLS